MSNSLLSRLLDSAKHRLDPGTPPIHEASGRRQFFRRASVGALGVVGTGMMMPSEAWAGVEERAGRFGITPGTVVDALGRPVRSASGSDPFIGEIMLFGGNFAIRGWAMCEGQLLPISSYSALFSLLGTIYGGDGRTTFALPDLRGRSAIGYGQAPGMTPIRIGEKSSTSSSAFGVRSDTDSDGRANPPIPPHPFLALNYQIALQGIFPSRS